MSISTLFGCIGAHCNAPLSFVLPERVLSRFSQFVNDLMCTLPPCCRMVEVVFSRRPANPIGGVEWHQLFSLCDRDERHFGVENTVSFYHHIDNRRIAQGQHTDLLD